MPQSYRSSTYAAVFVAALPLLLLAAVHGVTVSFSYGVHLLFVCGAAGLALVVGLVLSLVGARRADGRVVVLGTGFAVMAALLFLHGLATPTILIDDNGLVALAGGVTLPAGAAIFGLAAIPAARDQRKVPVFLALEGALVGACVGLGVAGFLMPSLLPALPRPGTPLALSLLAAGLVPLVLLALRARHTYLLTRRRTDLLVVVGIAWLAGSLGAASTQGWWDLGFWLGHGFEVTGLSLIALPVLIDVPRRASSRALIGDLRGSELLAEEEAYLGPHVRSLTQQVAEKDAYTEQHIRSVALLAVDVGAELGLPSASLRSLAVGGLLHDIGKLQVPVAILQKPGPLDDDEYAVVRRHPEWGEELLASLGYGAAIRSLVLDHHERLDGGGYPRGLKAQDINLDTRVLTVCDVFDALVADRVYRPAWSSARALELLRKDTGTAFDADCVAALERVIRRHVDAATVAA